MTVPKVHGVDKAVDPHVKPEHQKPRPCQVDKQYQPPASDIASKPRFPQPCIQSRDQRVSRKLIERSRAVLNSRELSSNIPRDSQPVNDPPLPVPVPPARLQEPPNTPVHVPPFLCPVPAMQMNEVDAEYDPLMDTDSPYDDALVEIEYHRSVGDDFTIPPSLETQIEQGKLTKRDLPCQAEIDRVMRRINRKVLCNIHLPLTLRDLQAAYLQSPQFRGIYIYLAQNRMPKSRKDAKRIAIASQDYMLLDLLLFKIVPDEIRDEPTCVLCIPTSKVDILLDAYHSSLVGGHAGITKCYLTISKHFYCPNLSNHIRAYITGCHVCQLLKAGPHFDRPYQKCININVPALAKISMDIKYMPATPASSGKPWKYLLILLCEVSNFVTLCPLKTTTTPEICKAIKHNFIARYGLPECIICDQDAAFTSHLMAYFTKQYDIKLYTVSVHNHQSLLAEHGIKSLSGIIKYLMFQAQGPWIDYVDDAMVAYNSYASPNLDGLSLYELVYGCKAKVAPDLEISVSAPVAGEYRNYVRLLQKQLTVLQKHLQQFCDKRQEMLNKDKELHGFSVGEIVYLHLPSGAILQVGSRKIRCKFVGPLVIYKAISPSQFLIMSLTGEIYPRLIEESRMKPGVIQTTNGNVKTLAALKAVLRSGYRVKLNAFQRQHVLPIPPALDAASGP